MSFTLSCELREHQKSTQLRKKGFIPAVIYGAEFPSRNIVLRYKEFASIFKQAGESQVIEIQGEGLKEPVLIHEVQVDPVSGDILHVDFYRFTKGAKVHAMIPLVFEGVSGGVKDKGGVLLTNLRELNVRGLPDKLVSSISVDLSALKELEDVITIGDLAIPSGIELLHAPADIVISVTESAKEVVVSPKEEPKEGLKTEEEESKTVA